jgi:hypothetical protein
MISAKRLKIMRDIVAESPTKIRYESNKKLYKQLIKYIKEYKDEVELYANILLDFPLWTLAFLNNTMGNPIFLAPWQIEDGQLMDGKSFSWTFCCRKTGKSTLMAAKKLHNMARNDYHRIVMFAPTHDQDFVFRMMRGFLSQKESTFLREKYIGTDGFNTSERIKFVNGSEAINRTIGITSKGKLSLGEIASDIGIDEIQLIEKEVLTSILLPILIDTYSAKNLSIIGTPSLEANPQLDIMWEKWKKDNEYGTYALGWERGVEEGCVNKKMILEQMEDMTQDEIDMMLNAKFPLMSDRFYPRTNLYDCGARIKDGVDYKFTPRAIGDRVYVMAVDWAKYIDRTQILVAEVIDKKLHYVYWYEINPKDKIVDYDDQISLVQDIFRDFKCKWICPDASAQQEHIVKQLSMGDKAIPPALVYRDEKERLGFHASLDGNYTLHRNHRRRIMNKQIIVPKNEHKFFNQWVKEHHELKASNVGTRNLMKFKEPNKGFKDLCVTSAMLSLYLEDEMIRPAAMGIATW